MTNISPEHPIGIFCTCCNKLLDTFDNEEDLLETGAGIDPDTGKQDDMLPVFCQPCGEKFKLTEEIDVVKSSEEYIRNRSVIGTMKIGDNYFLGVLDRQKLRADNFRF